MGSPSEPVHFPQRVTFSKMLNGIKNSFSRTVWLNLASGKTCCQRVLIITCLVFKSASQWEPEAESGNLGKPTLFFFMIKNIVFICKLNLSQLFVIKTCVRVKMVISVQEPQQTSVLSSDKIHGVSNALVCDLCKTKAKSACDVLCFHRGWQKVVDEYFSSKSPGTKLRLRVDSNGSSATRTYLKQPDVKIADGHTTGRSHVPHFHQCCEYKMCFQPLDGQEDTKAFVSKLTEN